MPDNPTTFVWLTNLKVISPNVLELAQAGRNRWIIENQGFNTQNNGGMRCGTSTPERALPATKIITSVCK